MKPDFALDLSHDGIRLLFRGKGGWQLVGAVALDDPQMSDHLGDLRQKAESLAGGDFTSKLVIPNSQILYTTLDAPGPDDIAREVQIRVALEGMTPYAVSDLVFDWRADGDTARVAVLARETMEEAEGFAAQFGFNPVSYVARPESGAFSGEPFFGKTNFAAQVMTNGDRLVPDTSPIPKAPKQMVFDGPADTASETAVETTPPTPKSDARPEPAPASAGLSAFPDIVDDEPDLITGEPPIAAAAPAPSDPTNRPPVFDRNADQDEAPSDPGAAPEDAVEHRETPGSRPSLSASQPSTSSDPAPSKAPRLSAPKRGQAETSTTPVLAPFPPTPEDEADTNGPSTPRPIVRATPDTPTSTVPTPKTAPAIPPVSSARPQTEPDDPASSEVSEKPAFSSRRLAPDTSEPPAAELPSASPEASDAAAAHPLAPVQKPVLIDDEQLSTPKLLGDAEKRRLAMARALGLEAGEARKPNVLARFGTGLNRANEKRRTQAEQRKADKQVKAKEAPKTREPVIAPVPDTPLPPPSAGKTSGSRIALPARKEKPKPSGTPDPREKEAEAMTVFGARKGQSTNPGRSSFSTGLTLTLLLILLLAGLALWSSYFLGDDDVALFNPETPASDTTETGQTLTPEPARPPETEAEVDANTAPEPLDVLTPEQAAEIYASTGVYQRAPDTPADPQASSDEDVYVASIDPSVSPNDALALPDPNAVALEAPASPLPPPPPGTSFDLDDNGLVVPTPEGAVSPSGMIVTQGRPSVVPAPRPEGLVPEEDVQEDAALSPDLADEPALTPRARPDNLTELAERARLGGQSLEELAQSRPRERPDDLDVAVAVASAAAAEPPASEEEETETATTDQTALASATNLAVAASVRPSSKPSNFGQLVARAETRAQERAPASDDGSKVIAASAATTRAAIPSSASVARSATMKNALNLRKINLIGVYGSNSSRRALVRLGSGRYVKVSVGDRLDGGRVTAISASQLIYQKGNRQFQLQVLPLG